MQGWKLAWNMRLLHFASNPRQKKMPASSWLPPSSRTSVPCGMVMCLCAASGSVLWSRTAAEVPISQSTLRGSGSVQLSVISATTPSCSAFRGNVAEPSTATGNSTIAYIGVFLVFTHILPKEDLWFLPQTGRVEGIIGFIGKALSESRAASSVMEKLRFLGLHAAAVSSEDASLSSPVERRNRHCAPPSGSRSFFFKGSFPSACISAQIQLVPSPAGLGFFSCAQGMPASSPWLCRGAFKHVRAASGA